MDVHSEDKVHSGKSGSTKSLQIRRLRIIRRRKHRGRDMAESVCEHVPPSGVPVYFPERRCQCSSLFGFLEILKWWSYKSL